MKALLQRIRARSFVFDERPSLVDPLPAFAGHIVVGAVAAALCAALDIVVMFTRQPAALGPIDWTLAASHLLAMYLPLGIVGGASIGAMLAACRRAPWFDPLRRRLGRVRNWGAQDAEVFSVTLALALTGVLFLASIRVLALHFTTRYHRQDLAMSALAAAAFGALIAVPVVVAVLDAVLRPLAVILGRIASFATAIACVLLGVVGAAVGFTATHPRLLDVLDLARTGWIAVAAALYSTVAFALSRRRPRLVPLGILAAGAAALAFLSLSVSALSYGHAQKVRSALEQRSVAGLRLVRMYADFGDRDRDGHSAIFGGRDCDDGDPNVHPGALDEPGDGVDADCFDGDGSPRVAMLSDGDYGTPPTGLSRPNFLLITIDALRPDHLHFAGYERKTSPRIDAFAAESVWFESAIAPSSRSVRSIPAMMTGNYASQVRYGGEYLYPSIHSDNEMVAEILRAHGYSTAAAIGTDYFTRVGGILQGFGSSWQSQDYTPPRASAPDRGLQWMRLFANRPAPWFLWVYLFNVHEPYLQDGTPGRFGERAVDRYDAEIELADTQVGRLLDELGRLNEASETVVIIHSDHGEAFGEHGNRGHSFTLYEEELDSTLLFRVPGISPATVRTNVSLIDVMPTVLNLAGIALRRPTPSRSLVPLMRKPDTSWDRLLFSELLPDGFFPFDQKAIRSGSMKLIWRVREGSVQLFDLSKDPEEKSDLSDDRPEEREELLGLLRAWVAQTNLPSNRSGDVIEQNRLERPPTAMTKRLDVRYPGLFTLLGIDLPKTRFRPGERIVATFYYRVDRETHRNLFFEVLLKAPPGVVLPRDFHAAHYPLNGRYFTVDWKAGEIIRDPIEIVVPKQVRHPLKLQLVLIVREGRTRIRFEGNAQGQDELALADIYIE